jgi:hypothetical protein
MAKGASNPTSNPEVETGSCDVCGNRATENPFAVFFLARLGRRIPRSRAPDEPSC